MALTAWATEGGLWIAVRVDTTVISLWVTARYAAAIYAVKALWAVIIDTTSGRADQVYRLTVAPLAAVCARLTALTNTDSSLNITDQVALTVSLSTPEPTSPVTRVTIEGVIFVIERLTVEVKLTARPAGVFGAEERVDHQLTSLIFTLPL